MHLDLENQGDHLLGPLKKKPKGQKVDSLWGQPNPQNLQGVQKKPGFHIEAAEFSMYSLLFPPPPPRIFSGFRRTRSVQLLCSSLLGAFIVRSWNLPVNPPEGDPTYWAQERAGLDLTYFQPSSFSKQKLKRKNKSTHPRLAKYPAELFRVALVGPLLKKEVIMVILP